MGTSHYASLCHVAEGADFECRSVLCCSTTPDGTYTKTSAAAERLHNGVDYGRCVLADAQNPITPATCQAAGVPLPTFPYCPVPGSTPYPPPPSPPPPRPPPAAPGTWPAQFPSFSQQCRDDAGPLWEDEEEAFGAGKAYHTDFPAAAVLQGGACAAPLQGSCQARAAAAPGGALTAQVAKAAYLEGPVGCGGLGWFCRILPDAANHPGGVLAGDFNFNHCNRTDYGDTDGHCHGSDDDGTYYWWVRDHWHRNYAGRLHCCCGWAAVQGVVARCDYRAPLLPGENAQCRDANEDHAGPGSGFSKGWEGGCPNLGTSEPLPEPDTAQCWDVLKFAPGALDN